MFFDFSLFRMRILDFSFSLFIGELETNNFSGALFMLYFDFNKNNRDFTWDFLFLHSLFKHLMLKIWNKHHD